MSKENAFTLGDQPSKDSLQAQVHQYYALICDQTIGTVVSTTTLTNCFCRGD